MAQKGDNFMTTTATITLEDHIRAHDQHLHKLRQAIRAAEDEISIHEALIALARNHRLIAAVEELHDQQARTSQFATDPHAYCTEQGIVLPEGVTLNPLDTSGPSARLTAVLRRAGHEVQVSWDSQTGFSSSGVPNRVVILAAQQYLAPGQGTNFPTYTGTKLTTLTVKTDTGREGRVDVIAGDGDAQEFLSTKHDGGQNSIQREWGGIPIGVTNVSDTDVIAWTG
jgi:hypothetical protein